MSEDRFLYLFDETANIEDAISFFANIRHDCISFCPLTTNFDFIEINMQRLKSRVEGEIELVPFNEIFHEIGFSQRDKYIDFISTFPETLEINGKNLKEYFEFEGFSLWWFSLISEKNPMKSESYKELCKLLSIIEILKSKSYSRILIDIDDLKLSNTLCKYFSKNGKPFNDLRKHKEQGFFSSAFPIFVKGLLRFGYTLFQKSYINIKMKNFASRNKCLANSTFLLVTYFPLFDNDALKQKKFVNKYYGLLQSSLEQKYPGKYSWIAKSVFIEGYDWKKGISLGDEFNSWGENFYFTEEWLFFKDFVTTLISFIKTSFKFILHVKNISTSFNYEGINIWYLFQKDWYDSFFGWTLIEGIFNYRIFNNFFSHVSKDSIVLYFSEMHAWEKALNLAAKKNGLSKVIAYQHTLLSLLLTMYFNSRDELSDEGKTTSMPKPDYLSSVGKIPYEIFKNSGWDEKKLFILGAIRFQAIKDYAKVEIEWNSRENIIIVATSMNPIETKEMLLFVHQALRNQNFCNVIIKGHPFLPVGPLLESMDIKMDESVFEILDTPLPDLLPRSKAMIVAESSSSLISIAFQCPIIIPYLANTIDMNPFSGISDIPYYANTPDKLRHIVERIVTSEDSPLDINKCKYFISNYFEILDSEFGYLERIEKKVNT